MLVTLCDYKQSVTLIANSGVQFLDFGLSSAGVAASNGRFVRKTANGPLLRLDFDVVNRPVHAAWRTDGGAAGSGQARIARIPLHDSPDACWTASGCRCPFLRFNPPRTFVEGPDNWARVQIRKLADTGQQRATLTA